MNEAAVERLEKRIKALEDQLDLQPPRELVDVGEPGQHGNEYHLPDFLSAALHAALGDSPPHHTKYTGAEAIAAVEGEATLDLGGAVGIAGLLVVGGGQIQTGEGLGLKVAIWGEFWGLGVQSGVFEFIASRGATGDFRWGYGTSGALTEVMYLDSGTGTLKVATIAELAANAGVTIETVLLKDGLVDGVDIAARDHAEAHAPETHTGTDITAAECEELSDGSETSLHDHKLTAAPGSDHTSSGMTATFTAHENVAYGDFCFINGDGEMAKADMNLIATASVVAMANATILADASGSFLLWGFARDDTWNWAVGGLIYLSTTGGATQTAPSGADDVIQILGVATHADRMLFKPELVQVEHTG